MKFVKVLTVLLLLLIISVSAFKFLSKEKPKPAKNITDQLENINDGEILDSLNPLTIENLRKGNYPGSDLVIEQTLGSGSNYNKYIASYKSEGLKIYGLLTVPKGEKPNSGWPVIIFNHGYIAPSEYKTTERYVAYQDGFAKNGYITFKSDYRGHGSSEGQALGAYGSNDYTVDVLNALSSLKIYKDSDPNRIGMWGHSMGGYITLRAMVVAPDIKAGVIWGGVVGSYPDLLNSWRRPGITLPPGARASWRTSLVNTYGTPDKNPAFWNSISATSYLKDISGPVELHHGASDNSVPVEFSQKLDSELKIAGKVSEFYTYPGDDHNITKNFIIAEQRSIDFFDKYVKNSK